MVHATHLRWKLEVPDPQEEALCAWLEGEGSSAFYREADPPRACYAYFPPDQAPPAEEGLKAFAGVSLLEAEAFGDEDWLAKSREGFGAFEVGTRFHVRPTWDEAPGPAGRLDLVVNPGLAFGMDLPAEGLDLNQVVSDMEKNLMLQSLAITRGNKKRAADLLGLKRTTFLEKMKRLDLEDPDAVEATE